MIRKSPMVWALLTSGAIVCGGQSASARHWQTTVSRPGLGIGGIGVSSVFVPAPGVSTPTVATKSVTPPTVTTTPVVSRNITGQQIVGSPGVVAPTVTPQTVTGAPGVAARAPATTSLPRGYYTAISSTAVQKMYKGEMCYFADGVYYRAEYYLGSLVYVKVS